MDVSLSDAQCTHFFLLVCSWYVKWVIGLTPGVNIWQIQICRVSQIIEQNIGVCPSVQPILECHWQLWPCSSSSLAPWWARFKVFDVPSLWCIIIEATALIDWHNHENQAADYHHKSWFLCIIFVYVKKNHNIYIIILYSTTYLFTWWEILWVFAILGWQGLTNMKITADECNVINGSLQCNQMIGCNLVIRFSSLEGQRSRGSRVTELAIVVKSFSSNLLISAWTKT